MALSLLSIDSGFLLRAWVLSRVWFSVLVLAEVGISAPPAFEIQKSAPAKWENKGKTELPLPLPAQVIPNP